MKACGNIYLVGMMGAGKTTIGKQLARALARSFIDLDRELERRTGVRIPVIFDIEGEPGFRAREARLLGELAAGRDLVVATGGGVVLDPANRACLVRSGLVVYLSVAPDVLYERTCRDKNRPLLQVADPRARIEELHRDRDPLYREVADIVVTGTRAGPAMVVRRIESEIRNRCAA